MSENEGESKTLSAFFLGFVVGCLLCLGAGGAFFWVQSQRLAALEMEARMQAEQAREQAEQARQIAEAKQREMQAEQAKRKPAPKKAGE